MLSMGADYSDLKNGNSFQLVKTGLLCHFPALREDAKCASGRVYPTRT